MSGLGLLDLAAWIMPAQATPDDNPFSLADEGFHSVDEALEYLRKLAKKCESMAL
jgi:hypothetical protein